MMLGIKGIIVVERMQTKMKEYDCHQGESSNAGQQRQVSNFCLVMAYHEGHDFFSLSFECLTSQSVIAA
jgi:hypothetical protein